MPTSMDSVVVTIEDTTAPTINHTLLILVLRLNGYLMILNRAIMRFI